MVLISLFTPLLLFNFPIFCHTQYTLLMTRRAHLSSSPKIAWSTSHPLRKCCSRYDILLARASSFRFSSPPSPSLTPSLSPSPPPPCHYYWSSLQPVRPRLSHVQCTPCISVRTALAPKNTPWSMICAAMSRQMHDHHTMVPWYMES